MKSKRRNQLIVLAILLMGITIGFALLSATLKINGTANLGVNQWDIHWASTGYEDGVTATTSPTISDDVLNEGTADEKTVVDAVATWEVELSTPGDYYEFTINAVNAGTIDAMVTNISNTVSPALPSYIKYSVTYADGNPIRKYHKLAKATVANNTSTPTTETYKVRVEYDKDAVEPSDLNEIGENGDSYTFTFAVTYGQADEYAYDRNYSELEYSDIPGRTGSTVNIGETVAIGNSTSDYKTLTVGMEKKLFVGYKLDTSRTILEGYACGLYNNEQICLKGPGTTETFNINKEKLLSIFDEFDSNTGVGCRQDDAIYICFTKEDTTTPIAYISPTSTVWLKINGNMSQVFPSAGTPGAIALSISN